MCEEKKLVKAKRQTENECEVLGEEDEEKRGREKRVEEEGGINTQA